MLWKECKEMLPTQLTSELELGCPAIDQEHRKLLSLANQVHEAIEAACPGNEISLRVGLLADATASHFQTEERLMRVSVFNQFELHKLDHDILLEHIQAAQQELESGSMEASDLLDFYIKSWVTHHMATFDVDLARFLKSLPLAAGEESIAS